MLNNIFLDISILMLKIISYIADFQINQVKTDLFFPDKSDKADLFC